MSGRKRLHLRRLRGRSTAVFPGFSVTKTWGGYAINNGDVDLADDVAVAEPSTPTQTASHEPSWGLGGNSGPIILLIRAGFASDRQYLVCNEMTRTDITSPCSSAACP